MEKDIKAESTCQGIESTYIDGYLDMASLAIMMIKLIEEDLFGKDLEKDRKSLLRTLDYAIHGMCECVLSENATKQDIEKAKEFMAKHPLARERYKEVKRRYGKW